MMCSAGLHARRQQQLLGRVTQGDIEIIKWKRKLYYSETKACPPPLVGIYMPSACVLSQSCSLFGWLVADGWYWFVLREKYRWLVAGLI
jgi:hypothetical protein